MRAGSHQRPHSVLPREAKRAASPDTGSEDPQPPPNSLSEGLPAGCERPGLPPRVSCGAPESPKPRGSRAPPVLRPKRAAPRSGARSNRAVAIAATPSETIPLLRGLRGGLLDPHNTPREARRPATAPRACPLTRETMPPAALPGPCCLRMGNPLPQDLTPLRSLRSLFRAALGQVQDQDHGPRATTVSSGLPAVLRTAGGLHEGAGTNQPDVGVDT